MNILSRIAGMAAIATVLMASPVFAQDWTLNPTYGEYSLSSGFTPDPYRIDLTAGGPNDVSGITTDTGTYCAGFAAEAPDVRLFFDEGFFDEINFTVESSGDTTLIINDPNGNWWCDDDSGAGLQPMLRFVPLSGQYDIWVGTFNNEYPSAQLLISEFDPTGSTSSSGNPPPPPSSGNPPLPPQQAGPDWTLDPAFGTFALNSGFTPDPYYVDVLAGGSIAISDFTGGECAGHIARAPDVRLNFEGGNFAELFFSVDATDDTTLVINDPYGEWWCDDDSGNEGLNPLIRMTPDSGQYDIWIGTYQEEMAPARLAISELYSH